MNRTRQGVLVLLLTIVATVAVAEQIRIGVAAMGPESGAVISEVAARAPYFLIFDGHGKLLEAVANDTGEAAGGAGGAAADLLQARQVTIFVAGQVGDRMQKALVNYGIEIIKQRGGAHDAAQSILENR